MITTASGTNLMTLDVNGETHLDGWVFTFEPSSSDNAYFIINNNQIVAGSSYIPPGRKWVNINATKGPTTHGRSIMIDIGDTASTSFTVNNFYSIPSGYFPAFTDNDWQIDIETYIVSDSSNQATLFYAGSNNKIYFQFGGFRITSGGTYNPFFGSHASRWHSLKLIGSGANQMTLYIDNILAIPDIPRFTSLNANTVHIGKSPESSSFIFNIGHLSNIRIRFGSIIYIQDSLSSTPSVPIVTSGTPTYSFFTDLL